MLDIASMVSQLRAEAKKFSDAADALEKTTANGSTAVKAYKRTGPRQMSRAARERISQTQKARWAEKRKHTETGTKKAKTTK